VPNSHRTCGRALAADDDREVMGRQILILELHRGRAVDVSDYSGIRHIDFRHPAAIGMNYTAGTVMGDGHQLAPRLAREQCRMASASFPGRNHDRRTRALVRVEHREHTLERDEGMIHRPHERRFGNAVGELHQPLPE
jgi:hypothetical protein